MLPLSAPARIRAASAAAPLVAERAPRAPLHALVAVLAMPACSLGLGDVVMEQAAAPIPLTIAGPRDGLVYTNADDEDPILAGLQLTLRVDVDDESIARVDLACDAVDLSDVVTDDLDGRRAAFFPVTLGDATEHPVVARAAAVEVRALLVADVAAR